MPSRCCEFVDSRLRRSPPDRASAVPMDKPGKTRCVSPTLPTGRRLLHKLHSTPQQHGMILISGNGEITSRLYAFSLFFPGSCPNNRDRRTLSGCVHTEHELNCGPARRPALPALTFCETGSVSNPRLRVRYNSEVSPNRFR